MNPACSRDDCSACLGPSGYVCRCLRITEEELLVALTTREIRSLRDLRASTGAGDGCTACHQTLQRYVERFTLQMTSEPVAMAG